jgi:transcription termination/antitermination protein NusA
MKITYTKDLLDRMRIFSAISHADIKDCFMLDDTLYFVVLKGQLGKAIGKGGMSIKKVQERLRQNVKVVEFNEDAAIFVRNFIYPLKVECTLDGDAVTLRSDDRVLKGKLIGRDAKHLNSLQMAVNRYFDLEVKVE